MQSGSAVVVMIVLCDLHGALVWYVVFLIAHHRRCHIVALVALMFTMN